MKVHVVMKEGVNGNTVYGIYDSEDKAEQAVTDINSNNENVLDYAWYAGEMEVK